MARKLSRRSIASYVATQLSAGANQQELVNQVAAYLIENRRTKELSLIVRDVQHHLAQKGHVVGTVTTAHQLSAATKKAIEAYTKDKTGASHVELDDLVDESVLGGIRLNLPGRELDTTIARQLTLLRTRHKKA